MHELIKNRYSTRAFAPDKIDTEILQSLFEAARWAPSSMNEQPWRFILALKDDPESFNKMLSLLNDTNRIWAIKAPLIILTTTKLRFTKNNQMNNFALYDAGQAMAYLTMQAYHMGLFARQMGGFNSEKAKEVFAIPDDFVPVTITAIGKKGDVNNLPELVREKEYTIRSRKQLDEILFAKRFNSPVEFPETTIEKR